MQSKKSSTERRGKDRRNAGGEREATRLADEIVHLVERTNGPVLLSDVDKAIPGFHLPQGPAYSYFVSNGKDEFVIWDQMTAAGYEALRMVLAARRVAMQPVRVSFYLLRGARIAEGTGLPYVLLPVRAANIDTPNGAMRVSSSIRREMLLEALRKGLRGYGARSPKTVRMTADQFSF